MKKRLRENGEKGETREEGEFLSSEDQLSRFI